MNPSVVIDLESDDLYQRLIHCAENHVWKNLEALIGHKVSHPSRIQRTISWLTTDNFTLSNGMQLNEALVTSLPIIAASILEMIKSTQVVCVDDQYWLEPGRSDLTQFTLSLPSLTSKQNKSSILINGKLGWILIAAIVFLVPFRATWAHVVDAQHLWTGDSWATYEKLKAFLAFVAISALDSHSCDSRKVRISLVKNHKSLYLEDILRSEKRLLVPRLVSPVETPLRGVEDFSGEAYMVNFANKYVGGGTLRAGMAQEELLFASHPELCLSMIFCPQAMNDNEAIIIEGAVKYFEFVQGSRDSKTIKPCAQISSERTAFLSVDATAFQSAVECEHLQAHPLMMLREINKLGAALQYSFEVSHDSIATGKWGCGCFRGNAILKFILQWIVTSWYEFNMIFLSFDERDYSRLKRVADRFGSLTIGDLFKKLIFLTSTSAIEHYFTE